MTAVYLGLDIAKDSYDAVLLRDGQDDRGRHRAFPNTTAGHQALQDWLQRQSVAPAALHACLEATGRYGDALAQALYDAGYTVSVVNPARIKAYAASELQRAKTDRLDAGVIARFGRAQRPRPWTPPTPEQRQLQALQRRLDDLQAMYRQEDNRRQAPGTPPAVQASIQTILAALQAEIQAIRQQLAEHIDHHPTLKAQRALLCSIPGISHTTATVLLAEIGNVHAFRSARQLAAYAGLTPRPRLSGSSVRGRTRLAKTGNARLRKALYFPAVVAKKHNPLIRAFCQRLLAAGKTTMCVLAAAMRKLLHLAFGILRSQRPFDPNYIHETT